MYVSCNALNKVSILNKGNSDTPAKISSEGKQEREWWLENTDSMERLIVLPSFDIEHFCDLSSYSWDANFDKRTIGDAWNINEKAFHINCKELLAICNSMRSLTTYFQNKHVKIFLDRQVEVQIINKM